MNFLQRAVAGVESRLDQVLALEPGISPSSTPPPVSTRKAITKDAVITSEKDSTDSIDRDVVTATPPPSTGMSMNLSQPRSLSPGSMGTMGAEKKKAAGRMSMQERLAAAMVNANTGGSRSVSPGVRSSSPLSSTEGVVRTASPNDMGKDEKKAEEEEEDAVVVQVEKQDEPREVESETWQEERDGLPGVTAVDGEVTRIEDGEPEASNQEVNGIVDREASTPAVELNNAITSIPALVVSDIDKTAAPSTTTSTTPRISIDSARPSLDTTSRSSLELLGSIHNTLPSPITSDADAQVTITQLRADLLLCETRRAEESQASSERIDALEEKLKYLARDSADEARRTAQTTSDPLQKEIAKRDERIALLMEEGEKLSKQELKQMNNLKKLRLKAQEDEKAVKEARKRQEKAEKDASEAKERLQRSIEAEKRAVDKVRQFNKLEVEAENFKRDRDILQVTNKSLKGELDATIVRAKDAESRIQMEALEAEKKVTGELTQVVERLQNEAVSNGERFQSEIQALNAKMEREADRARAKENELLSELALVENKAEVLRTRAEEVSSGASGDTQAKLLRQLETLQSQYAIASGNWQGIETSLLSRIAALEKERDELSKKEADTRRKAREINLKSKRLEADIEAKNLRISDLESESTAQKDAAHDATEQIPELEKQINNMKKDFERERAAWIKELSTKVEEERMRWEAERSRPASPRPRSLRRKGSLTASDAPSPLYSSLSGRGFSLRSTSVDRDKMPPQSPYDQRRPTMPNIHSGYMSPYTVSSPGVGLGFSGWPQRQDSVTSFSQLPTIHQNTNNANNNNNHHNNNTTNPYAQSHTFHHTSSPRQDSISSFTNVSLSYPSVLEHDEASITGQSSVPPEDRTDVDSLPSHNGTTTNTHNAQNSKSGMGGSVNNNNYFNDMISTSTAAAAGPSVQLVERMSAAVRRLEAEMAASRDELARMLAQRDEAREQVATLMEEVEDKKDVEKKCEELAGEVKELGVRHATTLELLGEKSEEVEELRADVGDLKQMYRDLVVQQTGRGG